MLVGLRWCQKQRWRGRKTKGEENINARKKAEGNVCCLPVTLTVRTVRPFPASRPLLLPRIPALYTAGSS